MTQDSTHLPKRRREGWHEAPNAQDQIIRRLALGTVILLLLFVTLRLLG
ncbi:MAG: hypothetical protein U1F81_24610 [Verrucomicrobiaceae bacterium]